MIEKSLNEKHALAHIGFDIAESRPPKKGLQVSACPHPLEVLWLFHHVLKTALYQLKAVELVPADTAAGAPSAALQRPTSGNILHRFRRSGSVLAIFCKSYEILPDFLRARS